MGRALRSRSLRDDDFSGGLTRPQQFKPFQRSVKRQDVADVRANLALLVPLTQLGEAFSQHSAIEFAVPAPKNADHGLAAGLPVAKVSIHSRH